MKKVIIDGKLAENIQKDFLLGMTYKQIMGKYHISQRSIKKALDQANLSKRKSFTNEEKESILNELVSGKPLSQIEKEYKITYQSLYQYAKEKNLDYKTNKGRKNHFNLDFFSKIDNEEKAYWFGFLYADGSIVKSSSSDSFPNRLQVNISYTDREVLVDLLTSIDSDNIKIVDYTPKGTFSKNQMSRISLNSKKMCEDMVSNGYRLLKEQSNAHVFSCIPVELHRHFIRGVFDGDGSIIEPKTFSIIGQLPFIKAIQEIIIQNCNMNETKLLLYKDRGNGELVTMKYGGSQIQRIYHFLYEDSHYFLKRKHNKFKETLNN